MQNKISEKKNSFFEYFKLLFVVCIISMIVYFSVFNNIRASRIEREIASLQKQIIKETNKTRNEFIKTEEKINNKKAREWARDNLGMINTKREDYIILD